MFTALHHLRKQKIIHADSSIFLFIFNFMQYIFIFKQFQFKLINELKIKKVKPDNILTDVRNKTKIKLCDFGSAFFFDEKITTNYM